MRCSRPILFTGLLIAACGSEAFASPTPLTNTKHSLAEMSFFIGTWTCSATEAGKPESKTHVEFEWLYTDKVLKETITSPTYSGQFMTVMDSRSNTLKGVAVDNSGGYIVWENRGFSDGKSSETGYFFSDGKMIPVSYTEFERVDERHYIIRDFQADKSGNKSEPTDTEDCTRTPSATYEPSRAP